MIVASFAFADEMPEGSKQEQAFYELSNEIGFPVDCPPELQIDSVQTGCALYQGDANDFASEFDRAIGIRNLQLIPVEEEWTFYAALKRYERTFDLQAGSNLRIVYDSNEAVVPNVTFIFAP